MHADSLALLELTPDEQRAADRDATLLALARAMNGPNAPSVTDLFPGAVAIGDLEAAASVGRTHAVKMALRRGEDVNGPGVQYATALHAAAVCGHLAVVRLLVACGADPEARDGQGRTPAEVAGRPEVAEFLRPARGTG